MMVEPPSGDPSGQDTTSSRFARSRFGSEAQLEPIHLETDRMKEPNWRADGKATAPNGLRRSTAGNACSGFFSVFFGRHKTTRPNRIITLCVFFSSPVIDRDLLLFLVSSPQREL
jgi:hypothetical protein